MMKKLPKLSFGKTFLRLLGASFALTISAATSFADNGMAMSWKAYKLPPNAGVRVGCYDVCNAYNGDTKTTEKRPVLCFVPGNSPIKPAYQVYAKAERPNDWQFYMNWSGGQVGLTNPVKGTALTSKTVADSLCKKALKDNNARMVEHHDNGSGGWSLGATIHPNSKSKPALKNPSKQKFWASINDQPANPWD